MVDRASGLRAAKHSLVGELFVRTADENYITARWCADQQLHADFLWLAVHALEKYLKAVLLLNGSTAKGYSHDIVRLYADVKSIAGPLLPDQLVQPPTLDIYHWHDRTADWFIEQLLKNGNADNRYSIYGYVAFGQYLHMLDTMVFAIRRLVCGLDERYIKSNLPKAPTFTNRDLLTRNPRYHSGLGMPLDEMISAKEQTPRRHAALNLNMEFAPDGYPHTEMRSGTTARNPVILRRILDPLSSDNRDYAADGIELAVWLLDKVRLPKEVVAEVEAAVAAAKVKHGLP